MSHILAWNRPRKGQRGFSVAELLTAVTIAAVVSGISVPSLVEYTAQYQVQSAANQLAFDISRARMKAVG